MQLPPIPTASTYAALRIVSGLAFTFHGVQKVFGILTDHQPSLVSQVGLGGVIELVAGVLIAVGLFTRPAAFLSSGTMAVAYTQFHWKFAFDKEFWPAMNHGELSLIYAFLFLFVAAQGAGIWSVQAARENG